MKSSIGSVTVKLNMTEDAPPLLLAQTVYIVRLALSKAEPDSTPLTNCSPSGRAG